MNMTLSNDSDEGCGGYYNSDSSDSSSYRLTLDPFTGPQLIIII